MVVVDGHRSLQSCRANNAFNVLACKLQLAEPLIATLKPVPSPGSQYASGLNDDVNVDVTVDVKVLVSLIDMVLLPEEEPVTLAVDETVLLALLVPVSLTVLEPVLVPDREAELVAELDALVVTVDPKEAD
jgi:hypothetical protein